MDFPIVIHGAFGAQFDHTVDRLYPLGTKMILADGRAFRYCKVGSSPTVAGRLYESEATTANWNDENPTVIAAAGAISVTVDVNATPVVGDFADGFLVDETNGHTYCIKNNTAADPTVLTLRDPLITDLALADTVSMFMSPYADAVIKVAAEPAAPVLGVAPCAIDAKYYGWLQTRGICGVLVEGILVVGDPAVASVGAVAGTVEPAGDDLGQVVGSVLEIGADTEIGTIFLTID